MKLSKDEMETTVNLYKTGNRASVYTSDPTYIRKLDRLCKEYPDEYQCTTRDEMAAMYSFPKKRVRFGHASKKSS